ncbi:sodium:proton antiporter [Micromonospora craniellae]|uniref:Cation:proton antiporter n=1 Tax=Micromonospora craniellae TaxID=2294034 RepID=A0A372FUC6_9ACTN|nr:cation:proton antiporter subunit C [Micromonospora craniellae]QOC92194.1 cation:proton antiporter subunit C [Micromonospora craniellae]RFS44371.1 cation:proton antiporter [Micromonospora craniellae]
MILALTVGALVTAAVYLLLQRDFLRVVLGFVLLSHGVNLLLLSSGGINQRGEPLGQDPDPATTADPLPQAFVLTAIVIAFAITIYLLVLAVTGRPRPSGDQSADPPQPDVPTAPTEPTTTTAGPDRTDQADARQEATS